MGRGYLKRKKEFKLQFMSELRKELVRLQEENKALKEDPQSVVGKFLEQFNDVVNQNQRLSALACALLEKFGTAGAESPNKTTLITRDEIEAFRGKRLQIKLATPTEGEKFEEAKEYVFSYEAISSEQVPEQGPQGSESVLPPACTDPNCTLPKDLAHTHDAVPVAPPEASVPEEVLQDVQQSITE